MNKNIAAVPKRKKHQAGYVIDNLQLLILTLPAIALMLVFSYWPMFGIVLAFKDFKVPQGILGSPWISPLTRNFDFFIKSIDAFRVTRNTLLLNAMFIAVTTFCAVGFALVMFEVRKSWCIKTYQTIAIIPSFVSWVAIGYMVYALLEPSKGMLNRIIESFGMDSVDWYARFSYWPVILLVTKIWQGVGLGSIIYYAALVGIDSEYFEAATVDGATRLQQIWYISLPQITSVIIIMTILAIGSIFRADFGLFYNVTRNIGALYPSTDVIDTYIFRALMKQGNVGMASAVNLIQSVVCFVTLLATNLIVRKIDPEYALF
jgi:putative aldouronate transport system permease protein